jgi:hypothetical protein
VSLICDRCAHLYEPQPGSPRAPIAGKPDFACSEKPKGTLRELNDVDRIHLKQIRTASIVAERRAGLLKSLIDQCQAAGLKVSFDKGIRLQKREPVESKEASC